MQKFNVSCGPNRQPEDYVCKGKGQKVRLGFLHLVVAAALVAGPAHGDADDEMEVPPLSPSVDVDSPGLAAATAVADCAFAKSRIEEEHYFQGLLVFDRCIEELRDPELKAHYLHFRGTILEYIRAHKRAIDDFERALVLEPGNVPYAVSLGRALLERGEDERALAIFRSSLRREPGNVDVLSGMGTSLMRTGDVTRASAFIGRALDIDPGHLFALRDRGLIFLRSGAVSRAIEDFDQAIGIHPNRPDLFFHRGVARRRSGDVENALADFNKSAELDPGDPQVLVNRGLILGELGRTEEAFADFTEAIDINPGTAEAFYGRGLLAARLAGKDNDLMEQARSDLKQAITLGPESSQLEAAMAILLPQEPVEKKRRY